MAYVDVPKDLTNIKTKFIGNFTKRQCICFGLGIVAGFPGYFIIRSIAGTTPAFYSLIAIMAPFFLFGIVEKDGLPLEEFLLNFIRHRFAYPQIRLTETENIYEYYDLAAKRDKERQRAEKLNMKGGIRKNGRSGIQKHSRR
jgi:hypothetical protein